MNNFLFCIINQYRYPALDVFMNVGTVLGNFFNMFWVIPLFLVAGMLLAKGKKENADEKKEAKNGWRQHFSVVGLKTVVLMISAAFLMIASVADLILLNL